MHFAHCHNDRLVYALGICRACYMKQRRLKNYDKVRATEKQYYEDNKTKVQTNQKRHYQKKKVK